MLVMFILWRSYFPFSGVINSNGVSRGKNISLFSVGNHNCVEKTFTPQRHLNSQTILELFTMRKETFREREEGD